ncbi:hypothetical protein DFJ74DRAFT_73921 [Hyaloraphidium curvatum]|nr:hypothetical protein DFJ74DRAFT_73921 [Hyaloraphidium curvatum]
MSAARDWARRGRDPAVASRPPQSRRPVPHGRGSEGPSRGSEPVAEVATVAMADGPGEDPRPLGEQPLPPPPAAAAGSVLRDGVRVERPDFFLSFRDHVELDTDLETLQPVKLGEGAFGVAYRAKLKRATPVAVKILHQRPGADRQKLLQGLKAEVEVWQKLRDRNVLIFHGYCDDPPAMVSELASGGDLDRLLRELRASGRPDCFPISGFKDCLLQVARGMRYLHSNDILHCDLKPANILVDHGVYKVADFGLSTLRDLAGRSSAGTRSYLPPETLRSPPAPRDKPGDVYSFGMVAYELACGERPPVNRVEFLISGSSLAPGPPYAISDDQQAWRLMTACTHVESFLRPSFFAIVQSLESALSEPRIEVPAPQSHMLSPSVGNAPSSSLAQGGSVPDVSSLLAPDVGSLSLPNVSSLSMAATGRPEKEERAADRIVLQVANGGYGPTDHPKNLPMASESVDLLRTVLVSFYGFHGSPSYDQSAAAIRTAACPALSSLGAAQGTSIVHLVGHGGDRQGRFVFEGVSSPATDGTPPADRNTLDLERDIIKQIPKEHRGLVVVLLDCCRGSVGTEDRPFNVDRDNVLLGFAARHGEKAYGCLYTFVLAEQLWKRFDRQEQGFTWRALLDDVDQRIVAGTAVAAAFPQGGPPTGPAFVQQPRHVNLGRGHVDWEKDSFRLNPRSKTTDAKEYRQRARLGEEFRLRAQDLQDLEKLQQSYPLATYMEDLFTGEYRLEMVFWDGRTWEGSHRTWTATDLLLELYRTCGSYRDASVSVVRLLCSSEPRLYDTRGLVLRDSHQMVFGFVKEAVLESYRDTRDPTATGQLETMFLLDHSLSNRGAAPLEPESEVFSAHLPRSHGLPASSPVKDAVGGALFSVTKPKALFWGNNAGQAKTSRAGGHKLFGGLGNVFEHRKAGERESNEVVPPQLPVFAPVEDVEDSELASVRSRINLFDALLDTLSRQAMHQAPTMPLSLPSDLRGALEGELPATTPNMGCPDHRLPSYR